MSAGGQSPLILPRDPLWRWFQCWQVVTQFFYPAFKSDLHFFIVIFIKWKQGHIAPFKAPVNSKLWVKPHYSVPHLFRGCNNLEKCWAEVYFPAIYKEKITNLLTKLIVQTRLEEQMVLNPLKHFRSTHIPKDWTQNIKYSQLFKAGSLSSSNAESLKWPFFEILP